MTDVYTQIHLEKTKVHRMYIDRGLRTTSSQLFFEFLFIKTRPPLTNFIMDSDVQLNDETESVSNLSGGQDLIKRNSKEIWREVVLKPRSLR